MNRLQLFTVFHGNLDFSALPDRDVTLVVSRCYWPLLLLAERARIPIGVEMPARTLRRVASEDPEWMKTFRQLAERGLVEPVASGLAQVVAPLVPADVNRANLELGREEYRDLLGFVPSTWFVNEQTWSQGLATLYRDVGARAVVMEWNNPASARPELRPLRFRPARLADGPDRRTGRGLTLLWNDCVIFQKLQRAAQGLTPERDYLEAIAAAHSPDEERVLCAYGGDLEIFDYRPGHPSPAGAGEGREFGRLAGIFERLASESWIRFVLPGVAADVPHGPEPVDLTTAAQPIPCKKQPRYNPTRWAVSGRDGLGMNTRCFALRRLERTLDGLAPERDRRAPGRRALVGLWRSDFRTRATEQRVESFQFGMGAATAAARAELERCVPPLPEDALALVINASDVAWEDDPIEVPLHLPPGRLHHAAVICDRAEALPPDHHQLEVHGRYRDGSIRRAILVLEPRLGAGEPIVIRPGRARTDACDGSTSPIDALRSPTVDARFLAHRGGALASLRFPRVADHEILGTVPHGSFERIEYTPDFYSGHVVAVREDGKQVTDLVPVETSAAVRGGAVRDLVVFHVKTGLGEWTKLYRSYRRHDRIDLVHGLHFHEARVASLRLGIFTGLTTGWNRSQLGYASVNGGDQIESFPLGSGVRVAHHKAVSAAVTASSCLGATEGWVSIGDDRQGVGIIGDRSQCAAVPLLEYEDVDGRGFLRVYHTLAETDETRATFFRGFHRVAFALVAHRNDKGRVRRTANAIERGLAYRTERGVGIARGL